MSSPSAGRVSSACSGPGSSSLRGFGAASCRGALRVYLLTVVSVALFGIAIAAFGFLPATGLLARLALLAIAQGADTVSSIFQHTILRMETPDALRGRLSAIDLVFVAGGQQLGQVESGVVAALWTPEASVVTGGLACLGMVFVAHTLAPQVARYRADRTAEVSSA